MEEASRVRRVAPCAASISMAFHRQTNTFRKTSRIPPAELWPRRHLAPPEKLRLGNTTWRLRYIPRYHIYSHLAFCFSLQSYMIPLFVRLSEPGFALVLGILNVHMHVHGHHHWAGVYQVIVSRHVVTRYIGTYMHAGGVRLAGPFRYGKGDIGRCLRITYLR